MGMYAFNFPREPEKIINGKYCCPGCKITLTKNQYKCLVCGQKIDWREHNEDQYEEMDCEE